MSKKNIFIIIAVLIISVAGGLSYYFLTPNEYDNWEVIPEDAALVFEISDLEELRNSLTFERTSFLLKDNEGIRNFINAWNSLELNSDDSELFESLTKNKTITLSFHNSAKDTLEFLATVPLVQEDVQTLLAFQKSSAQSALNLEIKSYQGHEFYQFKDAETNKTFYIFTLGNILMVSSQRDLLIESVETAQEHNNSSLLKKKQEYVEKEIKIENIQLYINFPELLHYVNSILRKEERQYTNTLIHFADHAFLDLRLEKDQIFLHGFMYPADSSYNYINCLEGQNTGKFTFAPVFPTKIIKASYYHLSNYEKFHNNLLHYFDEYHPGIETNNYESSTLNFHIEELFNLIDGDLAMAWMDNDVHSEDKFLYVKTKSQPQLEEILHRFDHELINGNDTLPYLKYHNNKIYHSKLKNLPTALLGDLVLAFQDCFYTFVDSYLVLSESPQGLRLLINELDENHTWSKSIAQNINYDDAFLNHNMGYYLNPSLFVKSAKDDLSEKGKDRVLELENTFKKLDILSIQLTAEENKTYTNLILKLNQNELLKQKERLAFETSKKSNTSSSSVIYETEFPFSLNSKPYLVRNHIDKSRAVLVQDSSFNFHFIRNDGKSLWSKAVSEPLVSDIEQVDLYKNRKIQYAFATSHQVLCLDRNGNIPEYFPIDFELDSIEQFSVFDYDNNKNYRYIVSTSADELYLMDKTGKKLEGWNPNPIQGSLAFAPKHFRIASKDYILAVQKDGKTHLFNRRGEYYKGFPKEINQTITEGVFIDQAKTAKNSKIVICSESGRVMSISLDGKVDLVHQIESGQRPSIITEPTDKNYVLTDGETVYNDKFEKYFDIEDFDSKLLQFYDLKSFKCFVSVNPVLNQLVLQDESGNRINTEELNSDQPISLLYSTSKKEFQIYFVSGNKLTKMRLKR